MKFVTTSFGRCARLGSIALVLLFSQQAFAVGTDAGVTIANQAQVDYDVGGVGQSFILSDPGGNSTPGDAITSGALSTDFVVDNRVDFTLVEFGLLTHTDVTPGEQNAIVQFRLENTGNATQDFRLVINNLLAADPDVHGLADTQNMDNLQIYVDADLSGAPDFINDLNYVDELIEGGIVNIFVIGDAALALLDGAVANVELDAIVADSGAAGLGGDTSEDDTIANGLLTVEVVFGDDLGDGVETAQDGYLVGSAALEITKAATLISDPFNNTTNPKAIPGAIIEYVITVANTGGETATNVVITDAFTDITLLSDFFAGAEVEIDNDGTVSTCTEEADVDVCTLAGGALTVGVPEPAAGLDVAAGTSMTITFRVTIN